MAYTALYRKWRPKVFEDVKGQDPIVRTLRNQINTEKIGHAYLFCGSRGTGKTTVARILARAVNCQHPVNGNPCGECEICRAIEKGISMNVVEVDAASNNSVDNVRSMIEDIQYPPTQGRYRVYIIDEVHMFSTQSFNALLKTLEEPPEYVIFILATTDPQKIPATILSRCQQYDFKRIDGENLINRLKELCDGENIEIEDKAVSYIARKAEGGMRDAISLLDQAAWGAGGKLTYEDVLKALGAVDNEVFSRFFRLTVSGDAASLLNVIDEVVMSGRDIAQFTKDYCWYLRNILLAKASSADSPVIDAGEGDREKIGQEAAMLSLDEIIRLVRIYSGAINDMRNSSSKRVVFEIATIKAIRPEADESVDALSARIGALETALQNGISAPAMPGATAAPTVTVNAGAEAGPLKSAEEEAPSPIFKKAEVPVETPWEEMTESAPEPKKMIAPVAGGTICSKWDEIFTRITDPLLKMSARSATPISEDGATVLLFENQFKLDAAKHYNFDAKIKEIARNDFGIEEPLAMRVGEVTASPSDAEADVRSVFPGLIIEGE